ncbi:hypothetical protein JCM8547_001403 [Rhodosporidiobolus lusitaniae]
MRFLPSLLLLASSAFYTLSLAAPARLNNTEVSALGFDDFDATAQHFPLSEHEKRDLEARATAGVLTTCKDPNHFALTFDDGVYTYGKSIRQTLEKNGAKGTFFARYKAGHVIGSHTWSHPDIATITPAQLNKQLDLVETALQKILGVKPRLFRAPYGSITSANLKVLQSRGYTTVGWTFDSNDANGRAPADSVKDYNKLAKSKGVIALNHETKEGTAKTVIPGVVSGLKSEGYKLVDVATCLGVSPYQSVGTMGKRDKTWTCAGTLEPGQV